MDATELNRAWEAVTAQVKQYNTVDPSQIDAFFARLVPQAMSDGFLCLTADNAFIRDLVSRQYSGLISRALEDLHGIPFTLLIEVDENQVPSVSAAPAQPAPTPTPAANAAPTATQPVPAQAPAPTQPPTPAAPTAAAPTAAPIPAAPAPEAPAQPTDPQPHADEAAAPAAADPTATYTFENFVIGDSNRMAYSMAVAVAEEPGKSTLNPLFIYGKSGLGKTHLLRAIQNYVNVTRPELTTVYADSAELLNDYMEASVARDKEKESYKNFKDRYESADVLLVDDVQYLQGKRQTLDILFQIFNKLTGQGRQVVLSADRAPKNIDIDERYKSRFNSGGTFDIQPPEVETKLGIVKSLIDEYCDAEGAVGFSMPTDIQLYIAENSSSNIRELKSAVNRIIYQMTYFNQPDLTLADARQLLEDHFSGGPAKRLTIADIQREVETFYKVSHADLIGGKRSRNIAYARQVGIYLCRQLLDVPFESIGKEFNRDHSTMMYSTKSVEKKLRDSREMNEEIEALMQIIRTL